MRSVESAKTHAAYIREPKLNLDYANANAGAYGLATAVFVAFARNVFPVFYDSRKLRIACMVYLNCQSPSSPLGRSFWRPIPNYSIVDV